MKLSVEHVSVVYNEGDPNEILGLPQVDFCLDDESPIVLTGPNGCGKSSLLKVLAGIQAPTSGVVRRSDSNRLVPATIKWLKQNSFLVWQQPLAGLVPDLTLAENLALAVPSKCATWLDPYVRSKRFKSIETSMSEILDFYDGQRGKRVCELSGGQQQRFALAAAHVSARKLLLFDEPTSSLDPDAVIQTENLLRNLCRRNQAISVVVTHQVTLAQRLGFREIRFNEIRQPSSDRSITGLPTTSLVDSYPTT